MSFPPPQDKPGFFENGDEDIVRKVVTWCVLGMVVVGTFAIMMAILVWSWKVIL